MQQTMTTFERIQRLLELPALIDKAGKMRVAQRAEKRNLEHRMKAREALVKKELFEFEEYKTCSNADERKTLVDDAIYSDTDWEGMRERLEQLMVAIEKSTHEEGVLDHERKALKAALEREYAETIKEFLTDEMLANRVMGRKVAA